MIWPWIEARNGTTEAADSRTVWFSASQSSRISPMRIRWGRGLSVRVPIPAGSKTGMGSPAGGRRESQRRKPATTLGASLLCAHPRSRSPRWVSAIVYTTGSFVILLAGGASIAVLPERGGAADPLEDVRNRYGRLRAVDSEEVQTIREPTEETVPGGYVAADHEVPIHLSDLIVERTRDVLHLEVIVRLVHDRGPGQGPVEHVVVFEGRAIEVISETEERIRPGGVGHQLPVPHPDHRLEVRLGHPVVEHGVILRRHEFERIPAGHGERQDLPAPLRLDYEGLSQEDVLVHDLEHVVEQGVRSIRIIEADGFAELRCLPIDCPVPSVHGKQVGMRRALDPGLPPSESLPEASEVVRQGGRDIAIAREDSLPVRIVPDHQRARVEGPVRRVRGLNRAIRERLGP